MDKVTLYLTTIIENIHIPLCHNLIEVQCTHYILLLEYIIIIMVLIFY